MKTRIGLGVLGLAVVALLAGVVQANVISVNFSGTDHGSGTQNVTGSTGVVSVGNWNNAPENSTSSLANLIDNTGANTGASVSWTPGPAVAWYNTEVNTGTAIGQLYAGRMDVFNSTVTITAANIPYASYNVYAYYYLDSAGGDNAHQFDLSVNGGTKYHVNRPANSTTPGTTSFVQWSANSQAGTGNYQLFSNLSGPMTMVADGGQNLRFITGFQIVDASVSQDIPEPATMALLGLAATGLGGYLRRRRTA